MRMSACGIIILRRCQLKVVKKVEMTHLRSFFILNCREFQKETFISDKHSSMIRTERRSKVKEELKISLDERWQEQNNLLRIQGGHPFPMEKRVKKMTFFSQFSYYYESKKKKVINRKNFSIPPSQMENFRKFLGAGAK